MQKPLPIPSCRGRNVIGRASGGGFGKASRPGAKLKTQAPRPPPDPKLLWASVLADMGWKGGSKQGEEGGRAGGQPYVGSGVEVQEVPDSGRGLVATRDLQLGELLLVCNPLAIMQGPPGMTPPPNQLVPGLTKTAMNLGPTFGNLGPTAASLGPTATNLGPAVTPAGPDGQGEVRAWLEAFWQLYGGAQEPSCLPTPLAALMQAPGGTSQQQHNHLQRLLHQLAHVPDMADLAPAPQQATGQPPSQPFNQPPGQLPPVDNSPATATANGRKPELRRQVQQAAARRAQLNAYGEPHQDVVVGPSPPGAPYRSVTGVWPAMALINHACGPNACTLLVGERLVVRAAADIPAGEEVTISYAGVHAGSPVGVRRKALQEGFGFRCHCQRCLVEQDYEQEPCGRAAQALHQELESHLRPSVLAALEAQDTAALQRADRGLTARLADYQALLAAVEDEDDRSVLECTVTPLCLELLTLATQSPAAQPGPHTATTRPATPAQPQDKGRSGGVVGDFLLAPSALLLHRMQRLKLLRLIAPGSQAEAQLSARLLQDSHAALGAAHELTREAYAACVRAHRARYGAVGDGERMVAMLCAHEVNSLADDLAEAVMAANEV